VYIKEGSGNGMTVHTTSHRGASNSGGALRGEPGGKGFCLWTMKDM